MATDSDILDLTALEQRASRLLEAALAAGADAADAIAVRSISRGAEVRNGRLEEIEHSESDDLGLRVFVRDSSAIVSTSVCDPAGFPELAERAVAIARVTPPDEFARLAEPGTTGIADADLDLLDPVGVDVDAARETALAAEAACLAVPGVEKSGGASCSSGFGGVVLVSSNGFSGGYLRSRHGISASAIAGSGTAMQRDYDFTSALHRADLEDPAAIGASAGERAVARLDPAKMDTGRGDVVFDPRVASTLVGHFAGAANAAAVARGSSMLRAHMGAQVFAPGVVIVDDPLRRRGLASRPFDGDGLASRALTLVRDGVLESWYSDLASARELGLESTAHAARGVGSPPRPSPTNLSMQPGERSPRDLVSAVSDGVYVTELIGRGANTVTGDYSRGAAGFRIRNGELGEPVAEITIAGNLLEMFARLVPANDLDYRRATNAPTILIEGMTIAGR